MASSVDHLTVVMRVNVNIMKASQYVLKNNCKVLASELVVMQTVVDSGQMRVLGFMNIFHYYCKNMPTKLISDKKHLMKLSLKIFIGEKD